MKQKILILVTVLLMAAAAVFYGQSRQVDVVDVAPVGVEEVIEEIATVEVVFGEGERVAMEVPVDETSTAYLMLKTISMSEGWVIQEKQYDFGIFVEGVNGVIGDADMGWIYYVNDESGQVAADQQVVVSGDVVAWRYIESIY